MKKTKQIISLLLTIQMLLACALIPGVTATDVLVGTACESEAVQIVSAIPTDTETEIPVEVFDQDELMPMAAGECSEDDPYPLTNGYYGSPGLSGGNMRVMDGGLQGAYAFYTFLTGLPGSVGVTSAIPGGGTARITTSNSAGSGYAVQIETAPNQPFKKQRVHFN